MRVKDPSRTVSEKTKRNRRPNTPLDEDSSDDIAAGLTCQHVSQAVSVHHVKKAVAQNLWSVCSECLKERRLCDGESVEPDIWLCLKCGFQGCSQNSEDQHSLKHFQTSRTEPHCIIISLSTWIIWCYECDEELSIHRNKKVLAQIVDFLQKHVSKTEASSFSKVIRLCEEKCEAGEIWKGKCQISSLPASVKGINNLGNTCFFNAVMQNLAQTHMLNELMYEVKEKGTKLKIFHTSDPQLDPLVVSLSSPGTLTSAMFLFLHSMKEPGKGPLSPKVLFNQLCQKAPRFKGFQQQDSQELLHYLLDAVRIEETKRIQTGILKAFNNPTTKTADEETRKKIKAYGREGVKMNFIDRIFVGELTSTVMCEECENISAMKEPFIDLSLPIIEERVSKPVPLGRMNKCKSLQEADLNQYNCTSATTMNNHLKSTRKHSLTKDKNQLNYERRLVRKSSSGEEEKIPVIMHQKNGNLEINGDSSILSIRDTSRVSETTANASQTDGSEKEVSHSESSVDADSEASEFESASKQTISVRPSSLSFLHEGVPPRSSVVPELPFANASESGKKMITEAIAKFSLSDTVTRGTELNNEHQPFNFSSSSLCSVEKYTLSRGPQNAFQTLSQSYTTSSKECSIQSCLYQFTSVELLMGNNKLLCENCTEKKQMYPKKISSAEKKPEGVYTNARKQLLISAVPAILILHLKRFHQAGLSLRKVNRHVDFPLVLDLAPFCSVTCKNVTSGERVLYGLYGIVEHSGSMRGGHYTAYVKVRTTSKKPLDHIVANKNIHGLKETTGASAGQWVHVSDTHVQMVPESRALNAQAYLLFYERIL
ncbi:ubiquitin carboxyl-terminal hydrolase 45 isoform X1 [Trichosurus vulpecula]|uniref:ubiquitin carboxyl-terminal hydrolase 45 isoform X1 n=1 Tax=Trichosurus vulpecula TaxID=9337 RepID=UPI00186ACE1A|nr:ubiquitin carboxyl-terminal hydrolase 45 isoform X1 [Trichosurus vulpecula]